MTEFTVERRRRRRRHDIFVTDADGEELGWYDLRTSRVHAADPENERLIEAVAAGWRAREELVESAQEAASDLPAPRNPLGRVFGRRRVVDSAARVEEDQARLGSPPTSSRRVRDHLNLLTEKDARWRVFHNLATPGAAIAAAHLIVSPAGVFVVEAVECSGSAVVNGDDLHVGSSVISLSRTRAQADQVSAALELRCGQVVAVTAVVTPVGLTSLDVVRDPVGVTVVPRGNLIRWLRNRGETVDNDLRQQVIEAVIELSLPKL